MNQPIQDAIAFCQQHQIDFGDLYSAHQLYGTVHSGPDFFAMVRPCHVCSPQLWTDNGDSILVTLLTGDMAECLRRYSGISPTLTFQRIAKGKLEFKTISYERAERLARHGNRRHTSGTGS